MAVNLATLIERFGSEDRCHAYLEELRWRVSSSAIPMSDLCSSVKIASASRSGD